MSIRFICDSTCDYTTEQAARLGITLVPLKVLFGEKEYFDGVDMKPEEFYDKLASAEELPTTSQPSPEAFLQYFRAVSYTHLDVYKRQVVCTWVSPLKSRRFFSVNSSVYSTVTPSAGT